MVGPAVYVVFSIVAAVSSATVALLLWRRRAVASGSALTVLMFATAFWAALSGLEEATPEFGAKVLLTRLFS